MAEIATPHNEVDRKLHRIALEAARGQAANLDQLARRILDGKFEEFSYIRDDQVRYSKLPTIRRYVGFAHALSLIREDTKPTTNANVYEKAASFQRWLGNKTVTYLDQGNASISKIRSVIAELLHESPPRLPTPDNVHSLLKDTLPIDLFKYSAKLVSLLKPKIFRLGSRRVILDDKVLRA